ncbi:MAG: glucose-1-phosphate adenylyltransferase family protein [Planctomycetota bacterium]
MDELLTLVLAGGRGLRLRPLTDRRAKPAVPFAGRRLVDFTLANCLASGLGRVVVVTQYLAETVEVHVGRVWAGCFDSLETFSARDAGGPFLGTADAVRRALARRPGVRRVLVLAGDHVYAMRYAPFLRFHEEARAAATLSAVPVRRDDVGGLGVLALSADGRVEAFAEKPASPATLPGRPEHSLASMGIYVFDAAALRAHLGDHPGHVDFGHDVLPTMLRDGRRVAARVFGSTRDEAYWRDIADVDEFHRVHLEIARGAIDLPRIRPGPGVVAQDAFVEESVICPGARVERGATVSQCVVLDGATVGAGARLRRAVVEEGTVVAPGTVAGFDARADPHVCSKTPGGVVILGAEHSAVLSASAIG